MLYHKQVSIKSEVTVVERSLLEWETDMKFDVVIGNPPYQSGKNKILYRSFVNKSLELSLQYVAMVTPASWNSAGITPFKEKLIQNGLEYYNYLANRIFTKSQNDVCAFICNKKKSETAPILVKLLDGIINLSNVNKHGIIPHSLQGASNISLLAKLADLKSMEDLYLRGTENPENMPTGNIECIVRNGRASEEFEQLLVSTNNTVGMGSHKVVVAYNSSIGNIGPSKYATPNKLLGYAVVGLLLNNREECDVCIDYLSSKLVKFIVSNVKTSIQNSKNLFRCVPKIDFSRTWTDAELYAHFGLTQKEIDYVEQTVK